MLEHCTLIKLLWARVALFCLSLNITMDALMEKGLGVATIVTYTQSKNTLCYTNVLKCEFYTGSSKFKGLTCGSTHCGF